MLSVSLLNRRFPMAVDPLMTIIRKFERVSDQARNICMEVHMCTGSTQNIPAQRPSVSFVDDHNSCRSQMAEAIASSLNLSRFIFASAGIEPKPVDCSTIDFMLTKGIDLSRVTPKTIHQIPNLDHYQVIVCLTEKANKAFPHYPRKMVFLHWPVIDPSKLQDSREEINKAYEKTYNFIKNHITDLVNAIIDTDSETGRE